MENSKSSFATRNARRRKDPASTRPRIEALEERLALSAATLDLTTRGSAGMINGAIFSQFDAQPTGTGVIDSFVRLQTPNAKATVEQGYNTDGRPLQFDENKSPQFTRSLTLGEVPLVNFGGVLYREFLLDINLKSSQPYLSLDELRLYVGDAPNLTGYDPATGKLAGLSPIYDMDAGGVDNWVKLDYRLNSGSGAGDMLLYIPDQLFGSSGSAANIYLYSKFGVNFAGNSGFEEWAAGKSLLTPANGGISGTIFNDVNQNGVRDTGEVGLPDVTVYLDLNNNEVFDEGDVYTTTDQNGNYSFNSLPTGQFATYTVRVMPYDSTWVVTTPDAVVVSLLTNGQKDTSVNFGLSQEQPVATT
jgi:hypothetical protein